ncbi:MAG: Rnase Y domain-containing protein, partial [Thermoguttaceae bacterium]
MSAGQWLSYVFAVVLAAILTYLLVRLLDRLRRRDAESEAREIVRLADLEMENRRREAELKIKETELQQQAESEKEFRKVRAELHERERLLDKRQDALEEQAEQIRKQEKIVENTQRKLTERIQDVNQRKEDLSKLLDLQRQTLHQLSGLSREEATRRLLEILDTQLQQETGALVLRYEKQAAEACEVKAREMFLSSIQRYAASHTAESTTSTVGIPNDEMKGRIIGREGRNIRAFEKATGVDVIIDDTPGVVIVSAFDMIRREVARIALTKLIVDGRIHPTRIEEIVAGTQKELDRHIQKLGEEACQETGILGLHERLVHLLGRLHFRTSYSQNVLRHSVEVAFIAGMLAEEMGLNGTLARRCGLLHD